MYCDSWGRKESDMTEQLNWTELRFAAYCNIIIVVYMLTVWFTTNWKILKKMRIPAHLTCLLKNLYQVKKQQLELDMEQ